jgi:hypothetical protein
MDYDLINAFLAHEDLSEQDQMLRQNVLSLNETLQTLSKERAEATQQLQAKERDLLKVSGALENQLSIVEHLARKMGLQPVKQEAKVEQIQEVEQVQEVEHVQFGE